MTTVAADTATPVATQDSPGRAARTPRRRAAPVRIIAPVVVFVLVLGIWYFASHHLIAAESRFLLPGPDQVVGEGLLDSAVRSEILSALGSTVLVAASGLVIAMVLGVGFAVVMSQARWAEYSLYPYAVILQTIP
ncbi:MAG: ABC transporter permease, partial [Nocardia sp.]|nr:ABC transporter permease [Nocardia sp.]